MSKKYFYLVLAISIVFYGTCAFGKTNLSFATAGTGGTYFPLGAGMVSCINKLVPDLNLTALSTGGSVENARLIGQKKTDFALNNSSEIYLAYTGKEMFKEPIRNIRTVCRLFEAPSQWITLQKSGIKTISDLAGKKVSLGPPGSGAAAIAEAILKSLNLMDKVKITRLQASDAVGALKDGHVDAVTNMGHAPTGFVMEAITMDKIHMLDIGPDLEKVKFTEKFPFYPMMTIPVGTYKGIDQPATTVGTVVFWTARADLSDDIVYRCIKAIFSEQGLKQMGDAVDVGKHLSVKEGLKGTVAPLHPGAERFFKEAGIPIPRIAF